jgi:hypothetical protein
MEAFAATTVALGFLGLIRLLCWIYQLIVEAVSCEEYFRSSDSETSFVMILLWLGLCVPMYVATRIALVALLRRGKAFEEIEKAKQQLRKQQPGGGTPTP